MTDLHSEMSEAFAFERFSRRAIKLMADIKSGDAKAIAEFQRALDAHDGSASALLIAAGLAVVGGASDYTASRLIFTDPDHPAVKAWGATRAIEPRRTA